MKKLLRKLLSSSRGAAVDESGIRQVERMLGHRFRNRELLRRALTHRSILQQLEGDQNRANELLEFLGDSVLSTIVVEYLYRRFPDRREGELSKLKSMLVSGRSLQHLAQELKLGGYIRMSENEARSGGRRRSSILEDTLEALVAALYLDGGWKPARRFIEQHILTQAPSLIHHVEDFNDKSRLLEYAQARGLPPPIYRVLSESGPEHAKLFKVAAGINGEELGQGSGGSKKEAQQQAARAAMELLTERDMNTPKKRPEPEP